MHAVFIQSMHSSVKRQSWTIHDYMFYWISWQEITKIPAKKLYFQFNWKMLGKMSLRKHFHQLALHREETWVKNFEAGICHPQLLMNSWTYHKPDMQKKCTRHSKLSLAWPTLTFFTVLSSKTVLTLANIGVHAIFTCRIIFARWWCAFINIWKHKHHLQSDESIDKMYTH